MVPTTMQAASFSNLPQLLVLQLLQLLADWQNPSELVWQRSLDEISRQCPLQRVELLRLAAECGRMPSEESINDEITKTIEDINRKLSMSLKIYQERDVISNDQYVNVNLGEALAEKTDMIRELRTKIRDIEMKQLTEMENRLEYEAELIQRIQEQQNQLESLKAMVLNFTDADSEKLFVLSKINEEQTIANSMKTDAECSRRTSLLSESMLTNFMSVGDRLITMERSQVQQQRTLASLKFLQRDQDDIVNENEKLKDEVERLEDELKNSTMESFYLREELQSKTEAINRLNITLENMRKDQEEDENLEELNSLKEVKGISFFEAVKLGDFEAVSHFLDEGMYANERDNAGWTLLHRAVENGNLMIVKMLVQEGADLYAHIDSHSGDLPIHTAAVNNQIDILSYFIANGVPVDERNYLGTTPLLAAVWDNQVPTIRFLVEFCNASINAQIYNLDNRTGLHLSALYGYDIIAEYFVEKKADVELRTSGNCTAHEQDHASDYNSDHCDKTSETPLHWAARYDNRNVAKILVDNGANIYAKDGLGRTPQEVARYFGHLRLAEMLGDDDNFSQEDI